MNSLFWSRMHGGATHFPIVLVMAGALFDALAFLMRGSPRQREFAVIGYWLIITGAVASFGAVFTGLALAHGVIGGSGSLLRHHLFVWPAFALMIGLGTWRFLVGPVPSYRGSAFYLATIALASGCIAAAGFFGGELLLGH
jgi:uncharacterized membrane protein